MHLSPVMEATIAKLTNEQQLLFWESMKLKYRNRELTQILAFLLGFHYVYLGRWGLALIFWCTCGGCGLWWIIDVFRSPGLADDYNSEKAMEILRDLKIMNL